MTQTWSGGSTLHCPYSHKTRRGAVHQRTSNEARLMPFPQEAGGGHVLPAVGRTDFLHAQGTLRNWCQDVNSRSLVPVTVTETVVRERQCSSGENSGPRVPAPAAPSTQPWASVSPYDITRDLSQPGLMNCTEQTSVPPKRPTPSPPESVTDYVTSHSKRRPCDEGHGTQDPTLASTIQVGPTPSRECLKTERFSRLWSGAGHDWGRTVRVTAGPGGRGGASRGWGGRRTNSPLKPPERAEPSADFSRTVR